MKTKTTVKEVEVNSTDDSPSVIAYRVGQLERTQNEGFARLDSKLDAITNGFVTTAQLQLAQKAADDKHNEQDARIDKLENSIVWGVRLVVGAVILGVVGTLLKANGAF